MCHVFLTLWEDAKTTTAKTSTAWTQMSTNTSRIKVQFDSLII